MRKFINLDTEILMALLLNSKDKKIGRNYPERIDREVRFRLEDLENLVKYLNKRFEYVDCTLDLYSVIDCVAKYDDMYSIEWDTLEDKEFYIKYDYASTRFFIVSKDTKPEINSFLRQFHEDERSEIVKAVQDLQMNIWTYIQDLKYKKISMKTSIIYNNIFIDYGYKYYGNKETQEKDLNKNLKRVKRYQNKLLREHKIKENKFLIYLKDNYNILQDILIFSGLIIGGILWLVV